MNELSEQQRQMAKQCAAEGHSIFIDMVKANRRGKLSQQHEDLIFSAEVFSGQQAKDYGLVDGLGTMPQILKDKYP